MPKINDAEIKNLRMHNIDSIIVSLIKVSRKVLRKGTTELKIKQVRAFGYLCGVIFKGYEVKVNLEKVEEIEARLAELEAKKKPVKGKG